MERDEQNKTVERKQGKAVLLEVYLPALSTKGSSPQQRAIPPGKEGQ